MIAERIFSLIQPHAFKLWRHSALYRPEIVRNKAYLVASKQFSDCEFVNIDSISTNFLGYSLLTTVYNESKSIEDFLNSILRQQALPSELIICDGGSSDNTLSLIESWQNKNKTRFPIKVVSEGKCSIARGRNIAAKHASSPIFIFGDAGTSLDKNWAERILKGFLEEVDLVCGWYKPVIETNLQKAFAWFLLPKLPNVEPATFLPSGRALGVRREIFEAVGGFPEYLSFAGEDSLFGVYAKSASRAVAFVPDAYCYWRLPLNFAGMLKTIFRYSKGDGESGELFWNYYIVLIDKMGALFVHLFALILSVFCFLYFSSNLFYYLTLALGLTYLLRALNLASSYGLFSKASYREIFPRSVLLKFALPAQLFGFASGVLNRKEIEARRIGKSSYVVIFLPESHIFGKDPKLSAIILSKLKEGKYITVIAAKIIGNSFRNARIENHLRSEFNLDAWAIKHRQFIQGEIEFIDHCQDALSAELKAKIA